VAEVQYYGTGRRKTSVAKVRLVPGEGKVMINGKDADEYFPREALRVHAKEPLEATATAARFNVLVDVEGGGSTGQAGAVRMGIARALLKADEDLRAVLKKGGFLSRDPRMKERKKYGLRKARRAPQFSKR